MKEQQRKKVLINAKTYTVRSHRKIQTSYPDVQNCSEYPDHHSVLSPMLVILSAENVYGYSSQWEKSYPAKRAKTWSLRFQTLSVCPGLSRVGQFRITDHSRPYTQRHLDAPTPSPLPLFQAKFTISYLTEGASSLRGPGACFPGIFFFLKQALQNNISSFPRVAYSNF